MSEEPSEALAFPGQGIDPVHAVAVIERHRSDPLVDVLADVTERRTWAAEDLLDTQVAQPVVVAAGLLATARLDPTDFRVVVGHSLGEITGLAFTRALDPADAVRLARRRADLGAAAQAARPGAMVAIMKLDPDTVEWIRRAAVGRDGGVLDLAVENGPRQVVLSGDVSAVRMAGELANAEGGVARVLGIGGAYHTPLLVDFVDALVAAAAEVVLADPVVPLVSATGAGTITTATAAPEMLGRALVRPVRWIRAMETIRDLGVTLLVDAGPGRTLANLLVKTPVLPSRALVDDEETGPGPGAGSGPEQARGSVPAMSTRLPGGALLGRRLSVRTVVIAVLVVLLLAELWARAISSHLPPATIGDPPEMSSKLARMQHLHHVDTVFLGNSMVDHGIDPPAVHAEDPEVGAVYNAGLAGAPVVGITRWAERFVLPNLHPTTVVVGLQGVSLLDINDIDALTGGGDSGSAVQVIDNTFLDSLDQLQPGTLQRIGDRVGDFSTLVKDRTVLRNPADAWRGTLNTIERKPRSPGLLQVAAVDGGALVARDRAFWDKYLTSDGWATQLGTTSNWTLAGNPAVGLLKASLDKSHVTSADFRSMLSTLKGKAPHVVVAIMPIGPGVAEAFGPVAAARLELAQQLIKSVSADLHVRVVDLSDAAPERTDFADPVHLNQNGARKVSAALGRGLRG